VAPLESAIMYPHRQGRLSQARIVACRCFLATLLPLLVACRTGLYSASSVPHTKDAGDTGRDLPVENTMPPNDPTQPDAADATMVRDCGPLTAPPNGSIVLSTMGSGATASLSCLDGYHLFGDGARTCQPDGTWSGQPAVCCPSDQKACDDHCVDLQTDYSHCGTCAAACTAAPPSSARCIGGRCLTTLATGQSPSDIAVDKTTIYWTDSASASIKQLALGGGTPTTLASGQDAPCGITVDTTNVYWVSNGTESAAVKRLALGSGRTPDTLFSGRSNSCELGVDDTSLYWYDNGELSLVKVPLAGNATPIVLRQSNILITGFDVDATNVYWQENGYLMKTPIVGGSAAVAVTEYLFGLAGSKVVVDSSSAYMFCCSSNPVGQVSILRARLADGALDTLTDSQQSPGRLTLDGTSIYWTNANDYTKSPDVDPSQQGTVMKIPLDGGAQETLVSGQDHPHAVVVDDTSVYWIAKDAIMKLTPK
jgi:hypothetical protein